MITPSADQLAIFKKTPGAISVHELIAIINVAALAPRGTCCEMGSHRGKSGIAAAIGLTRSIDPGRTLIMVDPLYDMENLEAWKHACQGHPDNAWQGAKDKDFHQSVMDPIIKASEGMIVPLLRGDYSINAIQKIHGPISYCFLDSDQHQYELVKEELILLRPKMNIGGVIGFHDFRSQFSGVEQAYREMLHGGFYEEIPIDWESIKKWVSENGGESGNESWHHCDKPAPCFFGALRRIK